MRKGLWLVAKEGLNDLIQLLGKHGSDISYFAADIPLAFLEGLLSESKDKHLLLGQVKEIIARSLNHSITRQSYNHWGNELGFASKAESVLLVQEDCLQFIMKAVEYVIRRRLNLQRVTYIDNVVDRSDIRTIAQRIYVTAIARAEFVEVCVGLNLPPRGEASSPDFFYRRRSNEK